MSTFVVNSFSISIDGYGAGLRQSMEHPLGVGGMSLHDWAFATRTFRQMFGNEGGSTGLDNDFAARGFSNIGASILGGNMFGPIRGAWSDERKHSWMKCTWKFPRPSWGPARPCSRESISRPWGTNAPSMSHYRTRRILFSIGVEPLSLIPGQLRPFGDIDG